MIAYLILFIKVFKSLRQLFGAKKVVANFIPYYLLFFIFLEKDRVSYLFIKGLKSFGQLFGAKIVAPFLPNFFCVYLYF